MAPTALTDYNELLLKLYRLSSELPVGAFQDAALRLIDPVPAHEWAYRDHLRSAEHENIVDEDVLLSQLAPHVMQALSLNRVMHLDTIGPVGPAQRGAAIADLRGVLYHADPFFHERMCAEWQDAPSDRLPGPLLDSFLLGNARYRGAALVADHHVDQGLLFIKVRERCRADALSPREQTVARLVAQGDTHKQIAQVLERSPSTIRNQIQSIYEKLEVGNVAGLIKELALAE
jgi:DNA-binding CsgD family transcriptional regulator